jgi:hypothetical protein
MSPVEWSKDSEYSKERRRWESETHEYGPPGRPYVYRPYPAMVLKAVRPSSGGPPRFEQEIAHSEDEEANLRQRGFVRGPGAALAQLEASERETATLAAERAYVERRMSPQAQEEARQVDESTLEHVPVIEQQPIRRKGWPKGKPRRVTTDG